MKTFPNQPISSVEIHKMSFSELACIYIMGSIFPLPALSYGIQSVNLKNDFGSIVCSIIIGNLVLWCVGLGIISISYQQRINAIENIRNYLGNSTGPIFALLFAFIFLGWYVFAIESFASNIHNLLQSTSYWKPGFDLRMGAVLGLFCSTLVIGGIRLIKKLSILICIASSIYYFYMSIKTGLTIPLNGHWNISFPIVVHTILLEIPGIINLPTLIRHSRSMADSYLALTILIIAICLFECSSIWIGGSASPEYYSKTLSLTLFTIPTILIFILVAIGANFVNIYFATACYETFIPRFQGTKGYAILGLIGTLTFTFIQISAPITFFLDLITNYVGVLCLILIIAAVTRLMIKHHPRHFEKAINFSAWIVGCGVATWMQVRNPDQSIHALFSGMGASGLFLLVVFFTKETIWAVAKLKSRKQVDKG